mmetsp:Transcript_66796/g.169355  ORF Transcript_66796/g.169355 Transcript_66796/m.169355 type:complete len:226 (-) Transcript_66796:23-700(-)
MLRGAGWKLGFGGDILGGAYQHRPVLVARVPALGVRAWSRGAGSDAAQPFNGLPGRGPPPSVRAHLRRLQGGEHPELEQHPRAQELTCEVWRRVPCRGGGQWLGVVVRLLAELEQTWSILWQASNSSPARLQADHHVEEHQGRCRDDRGNHFPAHRGVSGQRLQLVASQLLPLCGRLLQASWRGRHPWLGASPGSLGSWRGGHDPECPAAYPRAFLRLIEFEAQG